MSDFAVFIITHGRADNVITDRTLRGGGYTGPIYYVIDNEDKQGDQYRAKYGDLVKVFDKQAYADMVDEGDNFNDRRTTTHARNACFDLAAKIGVSRFLVLDDDYTKFEYRTNGNQEYPDKMSVVHTTLDGVFASCLKFLESTTAKSICLAQGGDFLGGSEGGMAIKPTLRRKVMNSFFCLTDRRFWFRSRLNKDVNTYLNLGFVGNLFFTIPLISLIQEQTQASSGGMSETYLESGTFVKSFTSVMYAPHSVKVSTMGQTNRRLHHRVNWKTAVPQIVSESMRKCQSVTPD